MSRLRSGFVRALLVVGAVLWPCLVAAQSVTGTISGTITDSQGQVIPGATVTVVAESTNEARESVSDAKGDFQVTNLQPGKYTVRVALQSFRTLERKNIVLGAGERLAVGNLVLEVGGYRRDRRRGSARDAGQHRRDRAQRGHHLDADRTGPGAGTGRHLHHAAAPGRALREHRRFARHELRHVGPQRWRCPPRLEQRHRRRCRRE